MAALTGRRRHPAEPLPTILESQGRGGLRLEAERSSPTSYCFGISFPRPTIRWSRVPGRSSGSVPGVRCGGPRRVRPSRAKAIPWSRRCSESGESQSSRRLAPISLEAVTEISPSCGAGSSSQGRARSPVPGVRSRGPVRSPASAHASISGNRLRLELGDDPEERVRPGRVDAGTADDARLEDVDVGAFDRDRFGDQVLVRLGDRVPFGGRADGHGAAFAGGQARW